MRSPVKESSRRREWWRLILRAATVAALSLLMTVAVYRTLRRARPSVGLMPRSAPGAVLEYDPANKRIAFDVAFTADSGGRSDEVVVGFRGSVDSGRGPLMYFTNRDLQCTVDGRTFTTLQSGTRQQVRCHLIHNFTSATRAAMIDPGPLMLHVRVQGRHDVVGIVRYCINATDDFWRSFLSSQTRTARVVLNPENCQ